MNSIERDDEQINQLIHSAYYDIPIADATKSWNKVKARLQKRNRRHVWMRRAKLTGAILAAALLINVFFNDNLPQTYARISNMFKDIRDHVVQVFFQGSENMGRSRAKTTPPSEGGYSAQSTSKSESVTIEEANDKLGFSLLMPSYMPDKFTQKQVRIFEQNGQYTNALIVYMTAENEMLQINQRKVNEVTSALKTDIHKDAGEIQEILVNENPAIMVILPDGNIILEWLALNSLKVSVTGKLTEEEIRNVARSLH